MNKLFNRKSLLIVGVLLTVIAITGVMFYKPIMNVFMQQIVRSAMAKKNAPVEDGLYAGLCGTGSPMPDVNRAGPCIAVLAGKHFFIVDAGEGSTRNVLLMNLPIGKADAILLTHFHSDHIADLGEMELQRWVGGSNKTPVDVIGPTGVEQVVQGFNLAFQLDDSYRVAHHGPETVPPTGAGGVGYDFGYAVTTDPGNNIFVTGAFGSTNITFGSTVLTNSSSVNDIFVVKYDSMGVVQWAKSAMGTGNDVPTAAGADVYGNVYVAGRYSSATLAFGSTTLTNAGATGYDIFLTKYDYAGNVLWAKSNGGSADDIVHALAIDDSSYVVLAGNFVSPTLHFGGSTLSYDGTGISALFIAKYDSLGHALWGATTGPGHSDANGVAVTIPGKIYLAGDYSDTTFWFGNDTVQNVIHTGTLDMFVAKFNEGPLSVPVVTAKSNMAVYPNPNNGMMTVSFGEPGYENIGIYDCLGRLIYQAPISKNETSVKINATDLSDGVYMLRTIHNGASESLPFVIRR